MNPNPLLQKFLAFILLFFILSISPTAGQTNKQEAEIKDLQEKVKQLEQEKKDILLWMLKDKIAENANATKLQMEQSEKSFHQQVEQSEKSLERIMALYFWVAIAIVGICAFFLKYLGKEYIDKQVSIAIETYAKAKVDALIVKANEQADLRIKEFHAEVTAKGETAILQTTEEMRAEYRKIIANFNIKDFAPDKPISVEDKKDLNQAAQILSQIKTEPEYSFDDWFFKGVAEYEKGNYDDAINSFTKALNKNPKSSETYYFRGRTYAELKEFKKAISDCNKAIELKPDDYKPYNNRGVSNHNLKQYNEAISDFTKAIELKPDFIKGYRNRALSYQAFNLSDKAIADRAKAVELESQNKK